MTSQNSTTDLDDFTELNHGPGWRYRTQLRTWMASQNSSTDLDSVTEVDSVLSERQQNTLTVGAQILQHLQRLKHNGGALQRFRKMVKK